MRETQMNTMSTRYALDAADRKVYWVWLRATLAAYSAVVLCGIAAVAFLAIANTPNAAGFLTAVVALASP
jgi:hypothetical protein